MSSRVRLMLQDFANSTSYTGKTAFAVLESLYEKWAKAQETPHKKARVVVEKVTEKHAAAHPYSTQFYATEQAGGIMKWEGQGYYESHVISVDVPRLNVGPLPPGPKWLRALEMWERIGPGHSDAYRFFVSRDNRRQAWRRSLCNPFHQNWGFKSRTLKPKRIKKNPKATAGHRGAGDWLRDINTTLATTLAGAEAPVIRAAPVKPVKPRVGIWN